MLVDASITLTLVKGIQTTYSFPNTFDHITQAVYTSSDGLIFNPAFVDYSISGNQITVPSTYDGTLDIYYEYTYATPTVSSSSSGTMKLGDAKQRVLGLINALSNNGVIESKNTNADYLLRMNGLFDSAQKELVKIAKPSANYSFTQQSSEDVYEYRYTMPNDFHEMDRITLQYGTPAKTVPNFMDYTWEYPGTIVIPSKYDGTFTIFYWKDAQTIPFATAVDTADTQLFDINDEAADCACYYVAAHLLLDENQPVANSLLSDYNMKKAQLHRPRRYGLNKIADVYNLSHDFIF